MAEILQVLSECLGVLVLLYELHYLLSDYLMLVTVPVHTVGYCFEQRISISGHVAHILERLDCCTPLVVEDLVFNLLRFPLYFCFFRLRKFDWLILEVNSLIYLPNLIHRPGDQLLTLEADDLRFAAHLACLILIPLCLAEAINEAD
jgi:hypothetical protein